MSNLLDILSHTVGDLDRELTINLNIIGAANMTNNDNRVSISARDMTNTQIAAGSDDFKGSITHHSSQQQEHLNSLTDQLIDSLKNEPALETSSEEIVDAVSQVREMAKQEKVNKLSLRGIWMESMYVFISNVANIYTNTATILAMEKLYNSIIPVERDSILRISFFNTFSIEITIIVIKEGD